MPLYRDEGVVLRTTKLGEADRIVTLLTRSHGKIRAVAKGVRRVKSRFGGRLEPFMRVDVLIATGHPGRGVAGRVHFGVCGSDLRRLRGVRHRQCHGGDRRQAGVRRRGAGRRAVPSAGRRAERAGASRASGGGDRGILVLRALALAGWTPRLHSCVVCGRHVAVSPVAGESGDDGAPGRAACRAMFFSRPPAG